jgi:crossover junction endodeoxyribonuclease RusA
VDIRELVIPGTPVSLQASARSRERWKARVRSVAEVVVPEEDQLNGLLYRDLRVWVVYFHLGEMDGDLDNIAKPLLDGLTGAVWSNDRQIAHLTLRRVRRDADPAVLYEDVPTPIADALNNHPENTEFVFVRAAPYVPEPRLP